MAATVENFLESLSENFRIILLGGLAVVAHGLPRTTKDADIWLEPFELEKWLNTLASAVVRFPGLQFFDLCNQQVCEVSGLPEVVKRDAVIRVIGLDRPLDIFRIPHNMEIGDFDSIWARAEISLNNVKVADEIDLLITKEGTGRSVDIADIAFLENKIRKKLSAVMPSASFETASNILSRYYDYEICRSALGNPDKKVSDLALKILQDSAAAGDPFAIEILDEKQKL